MEYTRVLLVDDDYLVLQDLKTLVNWESLGFRVAATASNGKTAMEAYHRVNPRLIICDISMPVVDGLDFIEQVRRIDPDVVLLILSSYDDFSYAQRAIKSGVNDYLLKNNLSRESLTSKLLAISKDLDAQQYRLRRVIRMLYSDYFALADPAGLHTPETLDETNRGIFEQSLNGKYWFIVLSPHLPFTLAEAFYRGLESQGRRLFQSLRDKLHDRALFPVACYAQSLVILGCDPERAGIRHRADCVSFVQRLTSGVGGGAQGQIMKAAAPLPLSPEVFRARLHPQLDCIAFHALFPTQEFVWLEEPPGDALPKPPSFEPSVIDAEPNHQAAFFTQLEQTAAVLEAQRDGYRFLKLYNDVTQRYRDLGTPDAGTEPYYAATPADCVSQLKRLHTACLGATHGYSRHMEKAIEYIGTHYQDGNLGVEEIAAQAGLSASRLSVLFKKEAGVTVLDYLTAWRVEQAVRLLKETNLKVYEVAAQVGYKSAQYFSQVFQKQTGKRPLDYRRP